MRLSRPASKCVWRVASDDGWACFTPSWPNADKTDLLFPSRASWADPRFGPAPAPNSIKQPSHSTRHLHLSKPGHVMAIDRLMPSCAGHAPSWAVALRGPAVVAAATAFIS